MMQVFNQINARKLEKEEYNVFENFCNNYFFFIVLVLTLVVQTLMVQFGGKVIQTIPLTVNEHLFCVGLGFFELFWAFIVKILPLSWFGEDNNT
jgi:hypothetical protein